MHTDLSPHLHTSKCNEIIQLLTKCHDDNPITKIFGICNSLDTQMVKCLKEERLARRKRNSDKAKETRAKVRQLLREDENQ